MIALYFYISGMMLASLVAALVMLVVGFFFATVSGNLCGVIGSSNNPVFGAHAFDADHRGAADGRAGSFGTGRSRGRARRSRAVVCVSSSVAGELMQDFKCGYILGATPRYIQIVELIAVVAASLVMYYPLYILHEGNIKSGGTGFGDPRLAAPQAVIDGSARAWDRRRRNGVAAGDRGRVVWSFS